LRLAPGGNTNGLCTHVIKRQIPQRGLQMKLFTIQFPGMRALFGMLAILFMAGCSHLAPLYQEPPISYPPGLTMAQAEKGIIEGCTRREWFPRKVRDGEIEATLHWRGYTVVVMIHYDRDSYTVEYVRSEKLNYRRNSDGTEEIHPSYNKWVRNLIRYINSSLERYSR
jgi:hypothetical protein